MPISNHKPSGIADGSAISSPRRSAPFQDEPGYYEPAKIWLFGNVRLIYAKLAHVESACGPGPWSRADFEDIEREAERRVLNAEVLVCGIHNEAHQRAAVVPLRWGAPRILVFSGGIRFHIGTDLKNEPFRAARLWRYQFDSRTDLTVSRRSPLKLPTFARHNPTVDRLIERLASGDKSRAATIADPLCLAHCT